MSSTSGSSRRGFLLFSGVSALATATITNTVSSSTLLTENSVANPSCGLSMRDNYCLQNFSLADFQPLIGQQFEVKGLFSSTSLKLTSVVSHQRQADKRPKDSRHEPFSLQFSASNEAQIRSEIQDLFHPEIGAFKVLINQVSRHQQNQQHFYEVVFG